MRSNVSVESIDFEKAVPTTLEDIAALDRARDLSYQMDAPEYLQFLLTFVSMNPPGRDIPPCHEPFELRPRRPQ